MINLDASYRSSKKFSEFFVRIICPVLKHCPGLFRFWSKYSPMETKIEIISKKRVPGRFVIAWKMLIDRAHTCNLKKIVFMTPYIIGHYNS